MIETHTTDDNHTTGIQIRPAADERAAIAATLVVLSESASRSSDRRRMLEAADRMAVGAGLEDVVSRMPGRLGKLLTLGAESGCALELLQVERTNDAERQRRSHITASILGYHTLVLILAIVLLGGIASMAWSVVRPFELDMHEDVAKEELDLYGIVLSLFTGTLVGLAILLIALGFTYLVRGFQGGSGPAISTYFMPNGRTVRHGEASTEAFRFLAVFVDGEQPLPDAFRVIRQIAYSRLARRMANTADMVATSGGNPTEVFAPNDWLAHATVSPDALSMPLRAESLRATADVIALVTDAELERGARMTRILISILIGMLLVAGFFVVAAPTLIYTFINPPWYF